MGDSADSRYQAWESNEEIRLFREYLKIPSVHPDVDYGSYGHQVDTGANEVLLQMVVSNFCAVRQLR